MVDEMSFARGAHPKVEIEQVNDWEGSQYRYCNEFLVDSDTLDKDAALEFLSTMGDCELCVGEVPKFKVHVHSDHPDQVLKYFLDHGQISEVFIHNMQIQSAERNEKLAAEEQAERKPLGFVAVAAGSGQAEILKSLGVDVEMCIRDRPCAGGRRAAAPYRPEGPRPARHHLRHRARCRARALPAP